MYLYILVQAEAEAKRLREERERAEDEGAYLAKKQAEQEAKAHDSEKVSHYAKLGSAFVKSKGDNPLGGKRPGGLTSPKRN